ncbi:hypothetical protein Q31b_42440 [Novipirellula aureliae]|uniref:Uncharacterized protein n=1 Tax=Novipirellula aureliae TaxID=2527966 RepID=A0A5C6DWF3_9BACT|nr:hypothetical protein Q31b_42440 [Novipirellula aureliae]
MALSPEVREDTHGQVDWVTTPNRQPTICVVCRDAGLESSAFFLFPGNRAQEVVKIAKFMVLGSGLSNVGNFRFLGSFIVWWH